MEKDAPGGPAELRELRRGVLGPCVLALLESRPRFGLELVRDLAAADGLLTSDGTVYPLLNRLRDAGLVTSDWQAAEGQRPRRYYSITPDGRASLAAFRSGWARFSTTVTTVLGPASQQGQQPDPVGSRRDAEAGRLAGTADDLDDDTGGGADGAVGRRSDPPGRGADGAAGRQSDSGAQWTARLASAATPATSGGRR